MNGKTLNLKERRKNGNRIRKNMPIDWIGSEAAIWLIKPNSRRRTGRDNG